MSTTESAATTPRLPLRSFLGYGAGDMANNLAFSLVITFLTVYLTDVALLTPAAVGILFLVMRLVDAFTDVIAGSIIDRTSTRFGKFRPYILVFSGPLVLMAVLTFSMPVAIHGTVWALVWAWASYFLLGSVFYTLVNVPYGSLAAAMTQRSNERAKLATFRTAGGAIMQVAVALAIAPALQQFRGDAAGLQGALTQTIIILGIVTLGLYLFLFFTSKEQVQRDVPRVSLRQAFSTLRRNRALGTLALASVTYLVGLFTLAGTTIFYVRDVFGDALFASVALALIYGPILVLGWFLPRVVRAVGKKRLFTIAAIIGAAGTLTLLFTPAGSYPLAVLGFLLLGISSGICNTLMWNLEADSIEYGELKTGVRTEGTTYAVFSFARKLAQAIGGAAGVWIIGAFGYVGGAEAQTDSAQLGIRIAIGAVPAVLFLLASVLIRLFPMNEQSHAAVIKEIHDRRTSAVPTIPHAGAQH